MPKPVINEERCKGCELCTSACPVKILALAKKINAAGYHPAECIDESKCIGCAFCAQMCPDSCIEVFK